MLNRNLKPFIAKIFLKTLSLLVDSDKKLKSTDIPHEIISFNLLKNLTK